MRTRLNITPIAFGLALVLAAGSFAYGQKQPAVPSHPRELKYPRLDFTPPKASAYRQVMNNGVVGYFVEDHDLPLTNVSITIRAGSYLDPAGKEGLAAAVGSQVRTGGTTRYRADDFDEEADFLAANISSFIGGTSGSASVNFLSKDADKALDLFFDMLENPAFQQDRLDLFKSQQLQQIERRNDRTDSIEGREWSRLLYGNKYFVNAWTTKDHIISISTRKNIIAPSTNNDIITSLTIDIAVVRIVPTIKIFATWTTIYCFFSGNIIPNISENVG